MIDELRSILLHMAESISLTGDQSLAEDFIGLQPINNTRFISIPLHLVDILRFPIVALFERAFDFAFNPPAVSTDYVGLGLIEKTEQFMDLIPRSLAGSGMGTNQRFMSQSGICQSVAIACRARWNLECESDGFVFTVQELALLANMSEGAVRNAIADKSADGLKAVDRRKPVVVDHADAKRWLAGRRGFISTFAPTQERQASVERLVAARNVYDLSTFLNARLRLLDPDHRLRVAKRGSNWIESLEFERHMAEWICSELNIDLPLFLGKLYEVNERQDGTPLIR